MKKIKVVQLGTTHPHASGIFKCMKDLPEVFEIIGVAEPDDKHSSNLDSELYKGTPIWTVADILKSDCIDAVIVETNEIDSTKYAQMAADAGINIHLDKPGGSDLGEYEKLVNTAKEKKIVFHTGYMYRFNPAVKKVIGLVRSGKLGNIYSVDAQMCIRLSESGVKSLGRFNGGMMEFLGCHMLDIVLSVLGMPDKVLPMCYATHTYDTESLDYGMAILKYKNASASVRSSAADVNGFIRRQFVVNGSRGSVEIKPMEIFDETDTDYLVTDMNITYDKEINPCFDCSEKIMFNRYKRYDDMMIDLAEIISGDHENQYSYEHEINLKRLIMAAGQKFS
ncbi:MAG: Gfo/Idh/MocA family oxidoreductase [Clostridia bacterium]|nr:Gfo/Idh/MocA family oxidoreductase [Clostridia bacterium]